MMSDVDDAENQERTKVILKKIKEKYETGEATRKLCVYVLKYNKVEMTIIFFFFLFL